MKKQLPWVGLVPLCVEDLDHVMSWVNDHEVLHYFAGRQTDISREDEEKYLRTLIASKTDRAFSIFHDDKYVGQCSINQIHWPSKNGRLFIVVKRSEQGQGYGPAAIKSLLGAAWVMGLHKVWLIVRDDNKAAQAVYERLGFAYEGVLRDEYRVGERYFDMVRMAILNPHDSR